MLARRGHSLPLLDGSRDGSNAPRCDAMCDMLRGFAVDPSAEPTLPGLYLPHIAFRLASPLSYRTLPHTGTLAAYPQYTQYHGLGGVPSGNLHNRLINWRNYPLSVAGVLPLVLPTQLRSLLTYLWTPSRCRAEKSFVPFKTKQGC